MNYTDILIKYLQIFPNEKDRQLKFQEFLNENTKEEIVDWNNFKGHIVASGFVYSKSDKKFLVLFHKDLNMFLYPGGHVDKYDKTPLEAAQREIYEETGLKNLEIIKIASDELIPFDIDFHEIPYNSRLNLPSHYHFDFRYLFCIDKISDISLDTEELSEYKWLDIEELKKEEIYGITTEKIAKLLLDI